MAKRKKTPAVLCGAKTKRGTTCRRPPTAGMTRCKFHGGKSHPGGPGHPTWKHGRTSRYVPSMIADKYQSAREDPEFLSALHELALLDARIVDLLERLESGEDARKWECLSVLSAQYEQAIKDQELGKASDTVDAIIRLVKRPPADDLIWTDIQKTIELRRRVFLAQHKRTFDLEQLVEVRQLNAMLALIESAIVQAVRDVSVEREAIPRTVASLVRPRLLGDGGIFRKPGRGNA